MLFKDMSDKELVELVSELHCSIYAIECFGTKDMISLCRAIAELDRRGIEVNEHKSISFSIEGEEIERFNKKGKAVIA